MSLLTSALLKKVAKVSCNFEEFFENILFKIQLLSKICILLQDTVTSKGKYLITRNCY